MQILATAGKLDWGGWLLGIWGAIISGGAGAVGAAFGSMVMDSKDWNLGSGLPHTLELMGVCFCFSGMVSLMKFLQLNPTPKVPDAKTP